MPAVRPATRIWPRSAIRSFVSWPSPMPRVLRPTPRALPPCWLKPPGPHRQNGARALPGCAPPRDGSDAFLTVSAETLLRPTDDPVANVLREALKGKIVLIGGTLREIDTHLTPLTNNPDEKMHGVGIHAHMTAQMVDGRSIGQLKPTRWRCGWPCAGVTALGFLVGWAFRAKRQGLLASGVASAVIVAVDTIVFWQFRIILPLVLALAAWFLGEFSGHYLGRWLGPRGDRSMWFAR